MTINIEYEAEKKLDLPYEEIIREVVTAALDYEKCPYEAEVNVLLTDDQEIHRINQEFRGIDRATDVLSFPMGDYETPSDFERLEEVAEDYFNLETLLFLWTRWRNRRKNTAIPRPESWRF